MFKECVRSGGIVTQLETQLLEQSMLLWPSNADTWDNPKRSARHPADFRPEILIASDSAIYNSDILRKGPYRKRY